MQRRPLVAALALAAWPPAFAHHAWTKFDQKRPLWVEGRVTKVSWRNPHVELEVEVEPDARLPADLAERALPAQAAPIDGRALLKATTLPPRAERVWTVELGPPLRMDAWKIPLIKVGDSLGVVGYLFTGEPASALLRAEYLFAGGKVYGLRSMPA